MSQPVTAALAAVVAAVAVAGCGGRSQVEDRQFTLRTHCGVLSAWVDGRLWLADPPLSDGSGNPPPGWGFNETRGTWRELGQSQAEFRARSGKVAHFTLARPGQRDPADGCE